jgi:hypothetical protein
VIRFRKHVDRELAAGLTDERIELLDREARGNVLVEASVQPQDGDVQARNPRHRIDASRPAPQNFRIDRSSMSCCGLSPSPARSW